MHIDNKLRIHLSLDLDSKYFEFYLKHRFNKILNNLHITLKNKISLKLFNTDL